ncbi:hypothetical protein EST38_g4933 [Candolleomyces aberdarensis]|uniref:Protein kinase domain-containing protein n=1 Tax=Candolleomyces aberdarensis TaxID=2316362 RepID=A0A4Q2DLR0_9AGAR|nr:hypothetical protein EST38_g4933 [Candolleomyces aberdarensis]
MDATRIEDSSQVVLKLVQKAESEPEEVKILKFFSEEPMASDPRNHCIQLIAVLEPPGDEDHVIVVMPALRPYDDPEFDTVGEGLDFIRQLLEGFAFLHTHRVVHRDVRSENVLLDGAKIYSEKWFPWEPDRKSDYTGRIRPRHSRTESPPRYFIIDFGFSMHYAPEHMPPAEIPLQTTDPSVPEFKNPTTPCDPFPIDVYTVGNLIRMDFIDGNPENDAYNGRQGFEFLRPLTSAMTEEDPAKRITMEEAVLRFNEVVKGLSSWKLRSRAIRITGGRVEEDDTLTKLYLFGSHWTRRIGYMARRVPAIPTAAEAVGQKQE